MSGELDERAAPPAWRTLTVSQAGRLDAFLAAALPHLSRRHLVELMAARRIRLRGGEPARKGAGVRRGDVVEVDAELLEVRALRPQPQPPLPIIHVDQHLVALDKPCGVASVARTVLDLGTAANFLIAAFPETAALDRRGLEAGFVHRLDTATSGALLAARRPEAYAILRDQFRQHQVRKRYLAVVGGHLEDAATCAAPIRNRPGDATRVEVVARGAAGGRDATTWFRPVATRGDTTLLDVEIRTGARHQIRVHLAHLGHPIAGDLWYGGQPAPRLMLHACEVSFDHPATGRPTTIRAAPPEEFDAARWS